jgi:UDP-GlcNAc:undecaprenyl-phosphate GlcNAc-1-phosphate transferase
MQFFTTIAEVIATKTETVETFSADQVLAPYVYVWYMAFGIAFVFTPIMRSVAMYYGIIDEPDQLRKMHSTPVAYLGGVAVFLGWISGLAMSQFLAMHRLEPGLNEHLVVKFSIVVGACVIVILGLWDDIRHIHPWLKIAGQVLAAIFLLAEGVGARCADPMLGPFGLRLQIWFYGHPLDHPFFPEWIIIGASAFIVIGVVVGCCNATNLMDGLDGLCGGVTGIIAAGFLFLAVHLAMSGTAMSSNRDALRIVLSLALLGAVLGFVPYNFNPASIFMGDTGSMFLGFACATQIILLAEERPKWFLASMVMFALPVLDTALAFARRYVNRRPIFSADKFHLHHQLIARGLTVRKTVVTLYGLAIFFVLLGAAIVFMRTRYVVAFYLVIFGSIIVAAYKMGMVHERPRVVTRRPLDKFGVVAQSGELEPGSVIEIQEREEKNIPAPTAPGAVRVAGAWNDGGTTS